MLFQSSITLPSNSSTRIRHVIVSRRDESYWSKHWLTKHHGRCRSFCQRTNYKEVSQSRVSPAFASPPHPRTAILLPLTQLHRRRNILQRRLKRLPHQRGSNLVCRPPGRNRKLHAPLPHVLRLHCLYPRLQTHHRRHLRTLSQPNLFGVQRSRCLVERN